MFFYQSRTFFYREAKDNLQYADYKYKPHLGGER